MAERVRVAELKAEKEEQKRMEAERRAEVAEREMAEGVHTAMHRAEQEEQKRKDAEKNAEEAQRSLVEVKEEIAEEVSQCGFVRESGIFIFRDFIILKNLGMAPPLPRPSTLNHCLIKLNFRERRSSVRRKGSLRPTEKSSKRTGGSAMPKRRSRS